MGQSGSSAADEWRRVLGTLDQDPERGFNLAHECCGRWAADADRLALVMCHPDGSSQRHTYRDLFGQASRAADAFVAAGLRRGAKVGAILTRQVEAWIAALGAWHAGMVYVPLFCGFGHDAIAQRLNAAGVEAVVVDQRWRQVLEAARPLLRRDIQVFTVPGADGAGPLEGDRDFSAELDAGYPVTPMADTAADETAVVMFTSGTTSEPKGCVIPHAGVISLLPWFDHSVTAGERDLLFTTTDPGWSFGLLSTGAAPMVRGVARVMYTGDFDPDAWLDVVEREGVTCLTSVPTAYRRLVVAAAERGIPSSVRCAVSAGEPLDADTAARWRRLSEAPLRDGYGQTELGMVLADLADDARETVPGSLSRVVPGWEARLLGEDGQFVEGPGQGEIVFRRPPYQLTSSYANARDLWESRLVGGEWFRTMDVVRLDEDDRWWFVGRGDDVIVTAGYNVGPGEIESVLTSHPSVLEAAAVAAPDPRRGSVVRAVVVLAAGATPSAALTAELQDLVRREIGRHAYPRIVDYVPELPKTVTGKVRRASLRDQPPRLADAG
ncbi:acyl-CoA synthetase [Amycolatopsis thermoflava]|uniref:Acetyl-CoA synthetase n=1 Tax=Amycolatopsis thermoflava TaxID=84480 RepID=A0A3N2H5F6_9PSEU|nr:AMP-binding protein [Amycolatopsis thermoflava]ROS44153.1 acetyl-CoA synthetase [Amycolatopsis thermoflava]